MIDVLLAHSYFLKYDSKQLHKMRPYAPLATLYAASALRARGYSVALFDAMLADGEDQFAHALDRYQPRVVALYEDSFNFLSKMCLSRMRAAACHMSELARARGATVLAAGPDVSDHPELYFPHGVQFALVGEADHTLVELLALLDDGRKTIDDGGAAFDIDRPSSIVHRQLFEVPGLALPDPRAPSGVFYTPKRAPER
ncbi:MAG: cobalamin-dependent protein, partial [Roseiflexaceae bacterium]